MKNNISQALILSAGPNGLGAIRSLNSAGIEVDIIAMDSQDVSLLSRLPQCKKFLSKPFHHDELLKLLIEWPVKNIVIIPTSDFFVDFLQTNQKVLSKSFKFILPSGDLSLGLIDKKKEVEIVSKFTHLPKTITELPDNSAELLLKISLPLIIKPRSNELNYLNRKNIPVFTKEELEQFYQEYSQYKQYCIVQELIEGTDDNLWVCNCTFNKNSELINAFTFQRLQLTPPHFGVTCYAESKVNKEVLNQVEILGKGLNYTGPAMVEFKYDIRDGLYKYIEINPRLGLCNYFDTSCNKNNVYATYCVVNNINFNEQPQKENRMFLSLYEDLYSRFKDDQRPLSVFKTYWHNAFKLHTFMYFSWVDLWPSFVMTSRQAYKIIKSVINKLKA